MLHGVAGQAKSPQFRTKLGQRRWDTRGCAFTFSSSPLPERIAKAAICGSASGRASKMMSSTPMGEVTFSRTRPSASSMRPSTCKRISVHLCSAFCRERLNYTLCTWYEHFHTVFCSESLKHTICNIQVYNPTQCELASIKSKGHVIGKFRFLQGHVMKPAAGRRCLNTASRSLHGHLEKSHLPDRLRLPGY